MKKKDWLDYLRVELWLGEVRRETGGASNYELDQMFSSEPGASSADRRKEFDFIERNAKPPRSDVLHRVELNIPGTRSLYEAPFWTLVRDDKTPQAQCTQNVEELLQLYGLVRLDWLEVREYLFGSKQVDEPSVFNVSLEAALTGLAWYDGLSLLFALYKEAKGSTNFRVTESVSSMLDSTINLALTQRLPWAQATETYLDLLNHCLNSGTVADRSDAGSLLQAQVESAKPILPSWLVEQREAQSQAA
ncbi:hypothetical protein [Acidovorax cavernicola]|uniref:Uncharacterized protein n=1 Tax=Acidovorax cavernicola TaxID=1675792 RepID=A0A9X8D1P1_9BURK|nr:hypothetical protein [Acidovorax cavernicola]RIX76319.1 hypothetical protein D3H34_22500 [Acidovorax cavernicola]